MSHGSWTMTARPSSRCLELLLASRSEAGPSLTFPKWIDQRTGVVTDYPAWCGFLIPREIVVAVGLPRSEFFWWMEDTEYLQWRIPRAGFEITRTPDAVVWHSAIRRGATKPGWKFYYETRNAVYYRLHIQRGHGRRFYRLARVLARTPVRILLQENHKMVKLALFVRGAFDGLFGRLGIRVPSDEKPRT